jgi:hypothetical protein
MGFDLFFNPIEQNCCNYKRKGLKVRVLDFVVNQIITKSLQIVQSNLLQLPKFKFIITLNFMSICCVIQFKKIKWCNDV